MRICLLSNYEGRLDGSFQTFAFQLTRGLSRNHEVLHRHVHQALSPHFWREVRDFHPDIVHYVPGPSLKSFLMVRALTLVCNGTRTVMTALQPGYSSLSRRFIPLLRPDLILVQSSETGERLEALGCRIRLLPAGVDPDVFQPASPEVRAVLRQKYGLDQQRHTVLTNAPVVPGRGLEIMARLARSTDCQVVVVGSTATRVDRRLAQSLEAAGCRLWLTYFPHVEETYRLADCYVFPSPPWCRHRMELPLSVIEAMACNLPVITTPFRALPHMFPEGDGFFFARTPEDFLARLDGVRAGLPVATREKVLPYSWDRQIQVLDTIYRELLRGGG